MHCRPSAIISLNNSYSRIRIDAFSPGGNVRLFIHRERISVNTSSWNFPLPNIGASDGTILHRLCIKTAPFRASAGGARSISPRRFYAGRSLIAQYPSATIPGKHTRCRGLESDRSRCRSGRKQADLRTFIRRAERNGGRKRILGIIGIPLDRSARAVSMRDPNHRLDLHECN